MKINRYVPVLFFALFLCTGCDIIDTSEMKPTTYPSDSDSIIPGTTKQLWIDFHQAVDHNTAEETLSLVTIEGAILYDITWDSNRVYLIPVEPWQAGQQYFLSCKGTITTPGGSSFQMNLRVSFYIDTDTNPPVLTSFQPAADAVVSLTEPITLSFSARINPEDIEKYIQISPEHPVSFSASGDSTTITITPDLPWKGLTRYEWLISKTLEGTSGVPVLEEYRGDFRTLEDLEPPLNPTTYVRVIEEETAPLLPISSLSCGSGIVFSYSEAVAFSSFKKNVSIEPDTTLQYRRINAHEFLVFPDDGVWTAGEEYTITVTEGVQDLSGNMTEEPFEITFTPDISVLSILSVTNEPAASTDPDVFTGADMITGNSVHTIAIDTFLMHSFEINLSEPLSAAEAQRFASLVSFEPFFPYYLKQPEIRSVIFDPSTDPSSIILRYTNISVPNTAIPEEHAYYRFSIPGGATGFKTDDSAIFPEDLSIILDCIEE